MTHALVLMAATTVGDEETASRMISELRDSEMPTGWGMPWEWDAFADGSVNPRTTAYAITTALAIHALLDAGEQVDAAVAEYWRTRLGWYSDQPSDAIWTPNTASMIAAAVSRMGYRDEAQEVFDRLAQDAFDWSYSERQPRINDLNHYAYVLWGAELARSEGVEIAWSTDQAVASLDRYDDVYPIGTELTGGMEAAAEGPWRTSGTGTALIVASLYGDAAGDWLARTVQALDEAPFVPRFAAHALLGICLESRQS